MRDQSRTKKRAVCMKNPRGVGHPPGLAILTQVPRNF